MTRRTFASQQMTARASEAQLRMMLAGATDAAVARMDVGQMQRSYRCDPRLVETLVLAEQDKRRRRGNG